MSESALQPVDLLGSGEQMMRYASTLSRSNIIPKAYQGNAANCFVALDIAQRLGVGVMEIFQNLYVVHGTPGFSSKYAIALANERGPFKGPIQFDYNPDPRNPSARAYATVESTGQVVEFTVDMAMAKADGWAKNSKYQTMPQLMLCYRAATLLVRLYCPEVLLGLQTAEEVQDVRFAEATVKGSGESFAALAPAEGPAEAPQEKPPMEEEVEVEERVPESMSDWGGDEREDPA